VDLWNFWCISL